VKKGAIKNISDLGSRISASGLSGFPAVGFSQAIFEKGDHKNLRYRTILVKAVRAGGGTKNS